MSYRNGIGPEIEIDGSEMPWILVPCGRLVIQWGFGNVFGELGGERGLLVGFLSLPKLVNSFGHLFSLCSLRNKG